MMGNPFITKIIKHPLRTYTYIGLGTFGLTLFSNTISLFTDYSHVKVKNNVQTTLSILFVKSTYYGITWPRVPYMILTNPSHYFVLGGAMKNRIVYDNKN